MKLTEKLALAYLSNKIKLVEKFSISKAADVAFEIFCTPLTKYNRPAPKIFETGTPLQCKFLGHTVKGFKFGQQGNPTILICHGWDSCIYKFDKFIKELVNIGYQVFIFDAVAHGQSHGKTFNVYQYAQFVNFINETYGPMQNFLAHSLGGMAIVLGTFFNKNLINNKTKLVLIAPGGEGRHFFDTYYKMLNVSAPIQKAMETKVYETCGQKMPWFSTIKHIKKLNNPTLWLHDFKDDACPIIYAQEVADLQKPNITFEFSNGLGHSMIYRDAGRKKIIFDFLKL
jgi:pimeloyl-ACP methyl ester carboxylesterase